MTIQIVLLSVFSLKCIKFIQEKTSCMYIILSHSWLANFESVPKWGKLNFGEEPKNTPPMKHKTPLTMVKIDQKVGNDITTLEIFIASAS
jgi:hypothetical protein